MSILKQIIDGSLLSSERLMREREFYSPLAAAASSDTAALAGWTKRVSVQTELASARELAGLSDAELAGLEAEFLRCQMRPRPAWQQHAVVIGVVLIALAGLGLALQGFARFGEGPTRMLQATSVLLLLVGMIPLGAALAAVFGKLHLDLSYGTTGLYVGTLDERHPWLYKAISLTRHEAAEEYRQRVLMERGLLRGADYVVMREIVRAHESLDQMRPARAVAEELQLLPVPVLPVHVDAGIAEPRLVHIGAGGGRG